MKTHMRLFVSIWQCVYIYSILASSKIHIFRSRHLKRLAFLNAFSIMYCTYTILWNVHSLALNRSRIMNNAPNNTTKDMHVNAYVFSYICIWFCWLYTQNRVYEKTLALSHAFFSYVFNSTLTHSLELNDRRIRSRWCLRVRMHYTCPTFISYFIRICEVYTHECSPKKTLTSSYTF